MFKRIAYVLVGVAVLGAVGLGARPRPLEVETATVTRGPLRVTVDEDGKTRVRERYTVSTPVAGALSRVVLRAGDAVEPGTVIARLTPLPSPLLDPRARQVAVEQLAASRSAEQQTAAAVAAAESAATLAQQSLARNRELASRGATTASTLEQVEAEARMKESELRAAHFAQEVAAHAVSQAQAALSRFDQKPGAADEIEVTSPVHGRVLHVLREDAGPVAAGTAIVEVGDLDSLEIVAELLSQDAVTVRPGMAATLSHWGGPDLPARVRRVEPAAFTKVSALGVEEQRVNVLLDLEAPADTAALGDGFAVEVSILTWERPDVLQVPTSALFRQGKGWEVFAVRDGRARLEAVDIGHRGPLRAEVKSGLDEGVAVVAHPSPSLKDGSRLKQATE